MSGRKKPVQKRKRSFDQQLMLNEIREVVGNYSGKLTEREMYEELLDEADKWKMRLEELDEEGDDE